MKKGNDREKTLLGGGVNGVEECGWEGKILSVCLREK